MSGPSATQKGACEICGHEAERGPDWAVCYRKCPRCGRFVYNSTVGWLKPSSIGHIVRLSGWVREQNDAGVEYPNITPDVSRRIARLHLPGLRERANRALLVIAKTRAWADLDTWFDPGAPAACLELQGRSYCEDHIEANMLLRILLEDGYLRSKEGMVTLSVAGILQAEAVGLTGAISPQSFVAMWFDESLNDAWTNGFDPAIRSAGFVPFRIDKKDYVGGISDEIMAEIRRSRFVVADYTGQANGVYFEAGFALGLGLTVIPTCRANEIDKLHFDIKHINTLLWDDPAELVVALGRRIRAVIGSGPHFEG